MTTLSGAATVIKKQLFHLDCFSGYSRHMLTFYTLIIHHKIKQSSALFDGLVMVSKKKQAKKTKNSHESS